MSTPRDIRTISAIGHTNDSRTISAIGHTNDTRTISVIGHTNDSRTISAIGHTNDSRTISAIGHTNDSRTISAIGQTNDSRTISAIGYTNDSEWDCIFSVTTASYKIATHYKRQCLTRTKSQTKASNLLVKISQWESFPTDMQVFRAYRTLWSKNRLIDFSTLHWCGPEVS